MPALNIARGLERFNKYRSPSFAKRKETVFSRKWGVFAKMSVLTAAE
jgi:hypothetical protein